MASHKRLLISGVTAEDAVISEDCIASKNSIFVGNMKLVRGHGELKVYHLKSDHVPTAVAVRDSSVASDEASTIVGWYEFSLQNGWYTSLSEVFPSNHVLDDFDVEKPLENVELDIASLQSTVAALDSVFSTDAERVQAFVEALAAGGNIHTAVQAVQDDVNANEIVSFDDRVLIRTEFATQDSLIKGTVSSEYSSLKLIQDIIVAESQANDADFVLDRDRLDLLEATYEDSDVNDAILVETQARQAAITGLVSSASGNGDDLAKLETRIVANENTFSDVVIAQAILTSKNSLIDGASGTGDTLSKAEDRVILLENRYSDADVDNEIDTKVAAVVDSAPEILNTLSELSTALGSDANFATTVAAQIGDKRAISDSYNQTEIDSKVDTEKARITQELLDRAAGDTALGGRLDTLEAVDYGTQAELDVEKGRIDQELLDRAAGDTALGGRLDVIEAVDYGTQAELDVEKARIDANVVSISQKANSTDIYTQSAADLKFSVIDNPSFTTKVTTPELHCSNIMSQNSHLKLGSQHTNDVNVFLNGQETLQITRTGSEVRYTAHGGSGSNRFNQDVICNGTFIFTPSTPASSSASGVIGSVSVDATYVYVCTATDTWRRILISTDASW